MTFSWIELAGGLAGGWWCDPSKVGGKPKPALDAVGLWPAMKKKMLDSGREGQSPARETSRQERVRHGLHLVFPSNACFRALEKCIALPCSKTQKINNLSIAQ
jgi:hypothetical protein